MAEQNLDDADVGVLFQEVRGEAVPQRVRRYPFLDPGSLGGGVDGAVELAGRERLDRIATREQPAARQQRAEPPALSPPGAQQFEQLRRQHGVPIFAALAAFDPQQHPLGIDIADLERDDFGDAQPGAVCGGERRLVLRTRRRLQQKRHLLDAQHGRQPARLAHDCQPTRQVRPVERHGEKEAQGRNRAVDARRLHAALRLVELEAAQILCRRGIGRVADEGRKCPDIPNVVVARLLAEAAHAHILDHARTQRAGGPGGRSGGHRGFLFELKVAGPSMLGIGCPDRHPLPLTPLHRCLTCTGRDPALPRERVRCVPGMLNSSEVKVLYPT